MTYLRQFRRFAVYYTPPPGVLADFGAAWLGWDIERGIEPAAPAISGLPAAVRVLTETPRKYGFHATVKPPFRLAAGEDTDALLTCFAEVCEGLAPVSMDGVEVSRLGGFVALRPVGDAAGLNVLCGEIVKRLDRFRQPASDEEIDRRRGRGLTPRQDACLLNWGYPYLFEDFRFHMTLTGNLSQPEAQQVAIILRDIMKPLLPSPFTVNALSLMGEADDGRFHLLHRAALSG